MSERDLRKCKSRQKMSGGFRTQEGSSMYCDILSVIETTKRRHINPFDAIAHILQGKSCFGVEKGGELYPLRKTLRIFFPDNLTKRPSYDILPMKLESLSFIGIWKPIDRSSEWLLSFSTYMTSLFFRNPTGFRSFVYALSTFCISSILKPSSIWNIRCIQTALSETWDSTRLFW